MLRRKWPQSEYTSMTAPYAGDLSPQETWQRLTTDPGAVLVDVRTRPEWSYVGLPSLADIGKEVVQIEWQTWPDGTVHPRFAQAVDAAGVTKDQTVLLLCRSGLRSRATAALLTAEGWKGCFHILVR